VVHIRGSSARTARFKELTGKMIFMNNRTKWNNWYEIFFIFFNLKFAVEKYCSDYKDELKKNILNFADWKKFRTIKNFFASFTRATLTAEGDFTFIDSTLFTMNVLIKHFQNQVINNPSFLFLSKSRLIIVR
jgi:hypothetical protein